MSSNRSARTAALIVVLGAMALSSCSNAATPVPSVSPSPAPNALVDIDESFVSQGGTLPDLTATGTSSVESLGGSYIAEVPNAWGIFPPAKAQNEMLNPTVTDVLGLWVAGATPETQHTIVVIGQAQAEVPQGPQDFLSLYFSDFDQPGVTLTYEIFVSSSNREVLLVDFTTTPESGLAEESVFFVFTPHEVVVGIISTSLRMDQGVRDAARVIADSLVITDPS